MRSPKWLMIIPIVTIASIALAAMPARADVQTNPFCWSKNDCAKAGGFYEESDKTCGSLDWYPCYANKKINIAVHIPGTGNEAQVNDIADYIGRVYRYGIPVAAILAVIAIMVGGLLWLTSAGAERLASAKKWIGNAIIGLLLTLLSYTILQTINPDLVRLSMPRMRMIRTISLGAKFCSQVSAEIGMFVDENFKTPVAPTERIKRDCGKASYLANATAKTCLGDFCPPNNVCVPTSATEAKCMPGDIGGNVNGDGDAFLDDEIRLIVVCKNGDHYVLARTFGTTVEEKRKHRFLFPKGSATIQGVERACGGSTINGTVNNPEVRGFAFEIEVNDPGIVDTTGVDDWYAVGRSSCDRSSEPIRTPFGNTYTTDPSNIAWNFVTPEQLISPMTIYEAIRDSRPKSFQCNMTLYRSTFPDR